MPSSSPFILDVPSFRFRALAALAGRAPLGGAREVALACFMAARLAAATGGRQALPPAARQARAAGARTWFASLALPAPSRIPLARLADATIEGSPRAVADALATVTAVTATWLDEPAQFEMERVIAELRAEDGAGSAAARA